MHGSVQTAMSWCGLNIPTSIPISKRNVRFGSLQVSQSVYRLGQIKNSHLYFRCRPLWVDTVYRTQGTGRLGPCRRSSSWQLPVLKCEDDTLSLYLSRVSLSALGHATSLWFTVNFNPLAASSLVTETVNSTFRAFDIRAAGPQPGFVALGGARGHDPRKGKWTSCRCRRRLEEYRLPFYYHLHHLASSTPFSIFSSSSPAITAAAAYRHLRRLPSPLPPPQSPGTCPRLRAPLAIRRRPPLSRCR